MHRTLDLSFNMLKHIPEEFESHLKALKTIFFVQNKISHIANLSGLSATLRSLELGGNRIRVRRSTVNNCLFGTERVRQKIEGLDALANLEELWLGKNKITQLEVRFRIDTRLVHAC